MRSRILHQTFCSKHSVSGANKAWSGHERDHMHASYAPKQQLRHNIVRCRKNRPFIERANSAWGLIPQSGGFNNEYVGAFKLQKHVQVGTLTSVSARFIRWVFATTSSSARAFRPQRCLWWPPTDQSGSELQSYSRTAAVFMTGWRGMVSWKMGSVYFTSTSGLPTEQVSRLNLAKILAYYHSITWGRSNPGYIFSCPL